MQAVATFFFFLPAVSIIYHSSETGRVTEKGRTGTGRTSSTAVQERVCCRTCRSPNLNGRPRVQGTPEKHYFFAIIILCSLTSLSLSHVGSNYSGKLDDGRGRKRKGGTVLAFLVAAALFPKQTLSLPYKWALSRSVWVSHSKILESLHDRKAKRLPTVLYVHTCTL